MKIHAEDKLQSFAQRQRTQIARIGYPFILTSLVTLIIVMGIYVLATLTDTPLSDLTQDPVAVNHTKVYIGLLSTIGSMIWTATLTTCVIGSLLIKDRPNSFIASRFLLAAALGTFILMVDDTLLLHEDVLPKIIGASETLIFAGYALGGLLFGFYFREYILTTDYDLLITSCCLMGLSIVFDRFLPLTELETFIEDSLKFAGLVFWLLYFSRTTLLAVRTAFVKKSTKNAVKPLP